MDENNLPKVSDILTKQQKVLEGVEEIDKKKMQGKE